MGLEIVVLERGFTSLVLLGSYFSYEGIEFSYTESFRKIPSIYCEGYFLS